MSIHSPLIEKDGVASASEEARNLSAMMDQLVDTQHQEEADAYGTLRARKHAYQMAVGLLGDAAKIVAQSGRPIPDGCVSTDSEGGIRIEWVRPASSVHLVVPPSSDRDGYIYHEVGHEYATEPATAELLAFWLRIID
jgi:hypothetical protein